MFIPIGPDPDSACENQLTPPSSLKSQLCLYANPTKYRSVQIASNEVTLCTIKMPMVSKIQDFFKNIINSRLNEKAVSYDSWKYELKPVSKMIFNFHLENREA